MASMTWDEMVEAIPSMGAEIRLCQYEEEARQKRKLAQEWRQRVERVMESEGFNPELVEHLPPGLLLAALIMKVQ